MTDSGSTRHLAADSGHPAYRPDIDGLRAIAVLAVIGFHAFPQRVRGGFVGVDVFFVISGFLISTILLKGLHSGTFSFVDFYARRIRRIFPALAVTLLAVIAFGALALTPDEYAELGKHAAASAGFVANFTLWSQSGYFDGAADAKPLLHLWSLGIEEQFYVIWPLVLWLSWRAGLPLLVPIATIGVASFAANVWLTERNAVDAFYFPHSRFWELMLGAALAAYTLRAPKRPGPVFANALAIAGLSCLGVAFALITGARTFPGWWALLPTIGAALLMHAGNQSWLNRVVLASPPLMWVGLISYPLYLWHWPLLSFARILVNPEGHADTDPSRVVRIGLVLISFLLAWATYRWIEHPIRTGPLRARVTRHLVTAMLLVGVVSASAMLTAGYPARVDQARARSAMASRMLSDDYRSTPLYQQIFNGVTPQPGRDIFLMQPASAAHVDAAVVGDSHAWVLFGALAQATTRSIAVIGRGTCAPLLGIDGRRRDPGVETPLDCQPLVDQALHRLAESDAPVVLVTGYFNQYNRNVRLIRDGQSQIALPQALRDTLTMLARSGKQVVLVHDVPEIPAACYLRQFPIWRQQARGDCTISRQSYEDQRRDVVDMVREVSQQYPNVRAYDPAAVLCDQERCGEIDGGHYLYNNDGHHLNDLGAQRLGADLAPFIDRQLAVH